MIFLPGRYKNKRTGFRLVNFSRRCIRYEFIRGTRRQRPPATNIPSSAKFSADVDAGLVGPGQSRIHSEMHSASFQSAARTMEHNGRGRQLCRAQTAADYSAFTDYAAPVGERRVVLFRRNIVEKLRG